MLSMLTSQTNEISRMNEVNFFVDSMLKSSFSSEKFHKKFRDKVHNYGSLITISKKLSFPHFLNELNSNDVLS